MEPAGERDAPAEITGRSPGRVAWNRLKADRVAMASGSTLIILMAIALAAPLIEAVYGISPQEQFQHKLSSLGGIPYGYLGGISSEHWFGLEPGLGRDIFIRLVYGMRTSLSIALVSAVITTVIGVITGTVAGYVGGKVDAVISWIIDFALAMPFLIVALSVVPTIALRFYGPRDDIPAWFRATVLIGVFAIFGWTGTARLVRGQVLSLREREYVEAARASGASLRHIVFQELLPNIWGPILVTFSLAVPAYVTGEAALSFLGIGMVEPIPDFGAMIYRSLSYLETDPAYVFFPGVTIFILVLAYNLFGDGLRDALDPKSKR